MRCTSTSRPLVEAARAFYLEKLGLSPSDEDEYALTFPTPSGFWCLQSAVGQRGRAADLSETAATIVFLGLNG